MTSPESLTLRSPAGQLDQPERRSQTELSEGRMKTVFTSSFHMPAFAGASLGVLTGPITLLAFRFSVACVDAEDWLSGILVSVKVAGSVVGVPRRDLHYHLHFRGRGITGDGHHVYSRSGESIAFARIGLS